MEILKCTHCNGSGLCNGICCMDMDGVCGNCKGQGEIKVIRKYNVLHVVFEEVDTFVG